MPRHSSLPIWILTATVAAAAGGAPETGAQPSLDPGQVPWTRLELEARKLFAKGRTEVRLTSVARSQAAPHLIASPDAAAVEGGGPKLAVLDVEAAFAGRRSETRIWFDPWRPAALQRLKLRTGRKGYQKTYRFADAGVYSRRRSPADRRQSEGPVGGWSQLAEAFYPYPAGYRECGPVTEPTLVLYVVSALGARPFHLCSYSDKTLHHVELTPGGSVSLDVDYTLGSGRRRQGRVEVDRVVLRARPVAAGSGDDFEFLGLEGDVDIYLDGRVPVEIAGRLPGLGRVRIKLTAAELE